MCTALHQHAARKTDRIQHAEVFFQRRIQRRVAAIARIRKAIRWTEHVRMRIAGARCKGTLGRLTSRGGKQVVIIGGAIALFRLHSGSLDNRPPFLVVGTDPGIELLRRAADRLGAELGQAFLHGIRIQAATNLREPCTLRASHRPKQAPPTPVLSRTSPTCWARGRTARDQRGDGERAKVPPGVARPIRPLLNDIGICPPSK